MTKGKKKQLKAKKIRVNEKRKQIRKNERIDWLGFPDIDGGCWTACSYGTPVTISFRLLLLLIDIP